MRRKPPFIMKLSIIIVVVSLLQSVGYSKIWYVKPDQTGDAPTIQAAIDSALAGDTVLVASGTYIQPAITFWEKDSLTVMSENGPEGTILGVDGYTLIMLANHARYLVIKGFTFENSLRRGLGIDWCLHVIVEENIFKNNQDDAILISASGYITIRYNLIHSNLNGIFCIDASNDIVIANNTISYSVGTENDNGIGIYLDPVGSYVILNNIITNNNYGVFSSAIDIYFLCNNVFDNNINYYLEYLSNPTGVNGNISCPPQFCGVNPQESENFYLQSDSPCAPGNHPDGYPCGVIGKYPVNCGTNALETRSWGNIKKKFK